MRLQRFLLIICSRERDLLAVAVDICILTAPRSARASRQPLRLVGPASNDDVAVLDDAA